MTGHRAFLAISALLVAHLWGAWADADDGPHGAFRFVWVRGERTESCAGRDAIAQAVTQRLGKNVFSESATRSIEAVLQHEGDLWEAHIYVRGGDGKLNGSRILTSRTATCSSIEAAATLAIALAIDPESAFRPAPPPLPTSSAPPSNTTPLPSPSAVAAPVVPCPPPEVPPAPPPPPAAAEPPRPCPVERPCPQAGTSPPPSSSTATVAVRAVAAFGLLPAASPGLALSAEIPAYRFLHATAGVLYLPEQSTSDGAFAFGMTAAWLGACARPWDSLRTSVSVCASALAGGMHSVVFGLEPAHPGDRVWGGGSLGAVFRVRPIGPLEAEVGADLVIPFTRYQYAVEQQPGTVFQQGPAAGVGFVGAGMSFP